MLLKGVRNAITVLSSIVLLEGHLLAAGEVVVIIGCITYSESYYKGKM